MKNPGLEIQHKWISFTQKFYFVSKNPKIAKILSQNGIGLGTQINIKAPYTEILLKMVVLKDFWQKNLKPTNEKF